MRILLLAALVGFVSAVDCPDGTFPSETGGGGGGGGGDGGGGGGGDDADDLNDDGGKMPHSQMPSHELDLNHAPLHI